MRRRLWIRGQRCHHGATGSVVAAVALVAGGRSKLFLALTGGALMVHDWKDHTFWFERGRGTQP